MNVYESKLLLISYDKQQSLLQLTWTEATQGASDAEFREELCQYAEIAAEFHPNKVLLDCSNFHFSILPQTQEWVHEHIHSKLAEAGIQKMAHVISPDLFAQLSIEQTMSEGNASQLFDIAYCDTIDEAREWLSNRSVSV
jgi:hypothetical protein